MLIDSDDRIDLSSLDQMTGRRQLERLQYRYPNLFLLFIFQFAALLAAF